MSLIQKMRDKWARQRAGRRPAPDILYVLRAETATPEQIADHIEKYKTAKSELECNTLVGKLMRECGPCVYVGRVNSEHHTDLRDNDGKPSKYRPVRPGDVYLTAEQMKQFSTAAGQIIV